MPPFEDRLIIVTGVQRQAALPLMLKVGRQQTAGRLLPEIAEY
jgi:hypothetical protein